MVAKNNLTPQEKSDYCVCSALQSILEKYDIHLSQEQIASKLTSAKNGFLVNDDRMTNFLNSNNLEYNFYWQDQTPFNERDAVLEEMDANNGIIGVDTHVYLLERFRYPLVEMIDPSNKDEYNARITKNLYELVQDMEQSAGFFAVIKRRS